MHHCKGSGFPDSKPFSHIYLFQRTKPLLSSQTSASLLRFSFKTYPYYFECIRNKNQKIYTTTISSL